MEASKLQDSKAIYLDIRYHVVYISFNNFIFTNEPLIEVATILNDQFKILQGKLKELA